MKIQTLCLALSELAKQGIPKTEHGVFKFALEAVEPAAFSYISRSVVDVEKLGSKEADVALDNPQILAYVLVHSRNKGFLQYARTYSPDESRLLGSLSIGFGGHSDLSDVRTTTRIKNEEGEVEPILDIIATIKANIGRELEEEIGISSAWLLHNARLVHHDFMISDPRPNADEPEKIAVGQAHRAVIFSLDMTGLEHIPKSTSETQDLKWVDCDEAMAQMEMYESWSQLLLTDFIGKGGLD